MGKRMTLKESQDNVSSCKHCERVCRSQIAKFKHEKGCEKNPKNK